MKPNKARIPQRERSRKPCGIQSDLLPQSLDRDPVPSVAALGRSSEATGKTPAPRVRAGGRSSETEDKIFNVVTTNSQGRHALCVKGYVIVAARRKTLRADEPVRMGTSYVLSAFIKMLAFSPHSGTLNIAQYVTSLSGDSRRRRKCVNRQVLFLSTHFVVRGVRKAG